MITQRFWKHSTYSEYQRKFVENLVFVRSRTQITRIPRIDAMKTKFGKFQFYRIFDDSNTVDSTYRQCENNL